MTPAYVVTDEVLSATVLLAKSMLVPTATCVRPPAPVFLVMMLLMMLKLPPLRLRPPPALPWIQQASTASVQLKL